MQISTTKQIDNLAATDVKLHNCFMSIDMLEKEMLELPARSRLRLAEKLIESVGDFDSPALAAQWDDEVERRVGDIESGREKGLPADQVMREARRKVDEARRVSSARRK